MPTLANYAFAVGDPNPRPVAPRGLARGSVVWGGQRNWIDVRTMSETADHMNQVTVLGVVTAREEVDPEAIPNMEIIVGDRTDRYAIRNIQINQSGAFTMLEVQAIRERAFAAAEFRRPGETVEQAQERGLNALRELIDEVTPILDRKQPDREPNLMEVWRD